MADNLIRWKRGDYIKLSKAVNKYNKQVNELQSKGIDYLPEVKDYQYLKESILTRKELNRTINSMKKFSIDNLKEVELESGAKLSSYEYKELINARTRARHFLEGKLETLEKENPYAKFGLETKEIEAVKKTISSLGKLESAKGFELNRIMDRIKRLGSYDVSMRRAAQYRKNYMEALEQMSGYDNYKILKQKLESIKNPEQFYEYVNQSTTLSDLFNYYETSPESQTYGGFDNNQEAFNRALEQLGLIEVADMSDVSNQITSIM